MIKKIILIAFSVVFIGIISLLFSNIGAESIEPFSNWKQGGSPIPPQNEIVMPSDSTIKATTSLGLLIIKSGKGLQRYYSWDGATRSVVMWPRKSRWFGSLGMYYPGPGFHWIEHNGISRGVLEEGQQHFNSIDEAVAWLKLPYNSDCVYRDDGLVVCYSKNLDRHQLNVNVWQIYIGGKTRSAYQESAGDRIWVMEEKDKPDIFKESKNNIYYVGGHKPTKLVGSNNNAIHTLWDK